MALSSGFFKSAKLVAGAAAVVLTLASPALAFHGGGGGGGFHGGGGGGFHGGGFGGGGFRGGGYRGGGWNGGGWNGGGWGGGLGPGWGWGGGWGVPVYGGYDPYYDDGYYGAPIVIRRARPVVVVQHFHDCIWRRVHVHSRYGWHWARIRYCAH